MNIYGFSSLVNGEYQWQYLPGETTLEARAKHHRFDDDTTFPPPIVGWRLVDLKPALIEYRGDSRVTFNADAAIERGTLMFIPQKGDPFIRRCKINWRRGTTVGCLVKNQEVIVRFL